MVVVFPTPVGPTSATRWLDRASTPADQLPDLVLDGAGDVSLEQHRIVARRGRMTHAVHQLTGQVFAHFGVNEIRVQAEQRFGQIRLVRPGVRRQRASTMVCSSLSCPCTCSRNGSRFVQIAGRAALTGQRLARWRGGCSGSRGGNRLGTFTCDEAKTSICRSPESSSAIGCRRFREYAIRRRWVPGRGEPSARPLALSGRDKS